jgi:hypothetical protein
MYFLLFRVPRALLGGIDQQALRTIASTAERENDAIFGF